MDIKEEILLWAKNRTTPFYSSDVFVGIDSVESIQQVSSALRSLFLSGSLMRKSEKKHFMYALPHYAGSYFVTTKWRGNR